MDQRSKQLLFARLGGLVPLLDTSFSSLNENEIEAIEAKLGERLPEDYRSFLRTYGASTFNALTSIRTDAPLPPSLSDDGLLPFGTFYGTARANHDFSSLEYRIAQFVSVL